MSGYCKIAPGHEWHGPYHAGHYGFPIADDDELFERLILEINQAGLSWLTILKKQQGFRDAYHGFKIAKVARYGERDRTRLLNDAGIIRNKLKVSAAIENAKRNGRWENAYHSAKGSTIPDDFLVAMAKNRKAKTFFETLNSANRYAILFRIQTATKAETRARRIEQFIGMLERHEKIHP